MMFGEASQYGASALPARMIAGVVAVLLVLGPALFGPATTCKRVVPQDRVPPPAQSRAEAETMIPGAAHVGLSARAQSASTPLIACPPPLAGHLSNTKATVRPFRTSSDKLQLAIASLPVLSLVSTAVGAPPDGFRLRSSSALHASLSQQSMSVLRSVVLRL